MELLSTSWEDASSTLSTLAAIARADYRSGDASNKLGHSPPGCVTKVKVKMRLLLVDPRIQGS